MRELRAKAERGSCFSHSEAFHFADVMLSITGGASTIHDTMRLSLAADYDQNRTQKEIERILPLHPPSCLTLVRKGVCPVYCKESVRKRNEDPLVTGTTPCSVWLRRIPTKPLADTENLVERIGTAENLRRAFFKLRQYHEFEDSLFFDPFDFDHFEVSLDANCEVLAKALLERSEIPFDGYLPVSLPKKINEAQELEYRGMSYSTVYDQAPIQAVFNIVAPIVENEFQLMSYGYRWNTDTDYPYRIFEDWREAYPRFRNDIMAALERQPNGFYICCDIKGYYDHVDHRILLEQLRKFVFDRYVYEMIERTVRAYTSTTQGGCGLPQGPAYARLLANLYLNAFYTFASQSATAYFRYVDDFVLVFEGEKDAEHGLEGVVRRLKELGLELSQDEAKKAVIEPNTDISRALKTLDKIHYGILEGTRHVEHLAPKAAEDFMAAVERHTVSPVTLEELLEINDILPSLLYVATHESLFPYRLKTTILNIVEFLIEHRWFYPKKLKTIFYRLLDLEPDEDRLREVFLSMEPAHKVYFLLSVYGCWQSRDDHRRLLESLVTDCLMDDSVYVWGFAVAIAAKLDMDIDTIVERRVLMKKLSQTSGFFGLLKWLPTIDYLDQSDDERASIRNLVGPMRPDLVKMLLLTKVTTLPTDYVDSVYLDGLLRNSGVLLLPATCDLIVAATDKGELFDSLLRFVVSRLAFKPLAVSFVTKGIFKKRDSSGLAEIENLKALYVHVPDDELRQCMLGSVSRIMQYGLACDKEFGKLHRQIARYNECFLFERVDEGGRYDYLELIPERTLRKNIHCDLDAFRAIMDDFGEKEIMPSSKVSYDSAKKEVRLEFRVDRCCRQLDPSEFSLTPESILRACVLSADIFRKACYFRRFTGKAPHISPENLLINAATGSVLFRTVGRSLCALHVFEGATVGDEETDIAKMLSTFLEALMFESRSETREFLQETTQQGIYAFLSLFIKIMRAKDPGHRYSCPRFVYLVEQLKRAGESGLTQNWLGIVYLRERLKGALFRFNLVKTTWHGVCRALNEHISTHIRAVCSPQTLRAFQFRSRISFSGRGKRQLHAVSRNLLELSLCREYFPHAEKDNAAYLDLVEFLLLFASICIEIAALGKTLRSTHALQDLSSSTVLARDRVQVIAAGYKKEVIGADLAALVIRRRKEKTDEATSVLSLQQLSLQALFACGIEIDDVITVKKPKALSDEVFRIFSHACFVRIPSIEISVEDHLRQVFLALRSNEDFGRLERLEEMRYAVAILAQDLRRVRSGLGLSRQRGLADGRYFPPDVRCRSWFHRPRRVKEYALPGCALTNRFPSSREGYVCSWDLKNGRVANLMIPSVGVNSLILDLKKGKFLGFKLSYIYSGRAMLIWDVVVFALIIIVLLIFENLKGSTIAHAGVKAICGVLGYIFGPLAFIICCKLVIHDFTHWVPWYRKVIMHIRQKFAGEREPPESSA